MFESLRPDVDVAIWSDPGIDWSHFSTVVIRSCWDYHLRLDEFLAWIDRLEKSAIRVINAPGLLRWNSNKRYLAELAGKGIAIPETIWLEDGEQFELRGRRRVVKPLVSASAYRTELRDSGLVTGPMMVQEYISEIETEGEWSLMFFGGNLSHAVRKRAKSGEFRVQREFGGSSELEDAPSQVIASAERAVAASPGMPVYARVDLVQRGSSALLMELELIEPELFLQLSHGSSDRLAGEIRR